MLPHVIITRSYCSPARLLPPLSWRGSGQGQTGRAGRAETEYYHWGESCFMLLCTRPAGQLTAASHNKSDSCWKTQTRVKRNLSKSLLFSFLPCPESYVFQRFYAPINCTQVLTRQLPLACPPWRLRGQYLTLPPATLSSVTHSSHSIQTAS